MAFGVVQTNHLQRFHILLPLAKVSIATGHAMQIYNCLGQLRQL